MNVTHVSLRPTEAAQNAPRPALTPELLAATGARYSRSNDGLQAILAKIDPQNPDKSVDAIFKFVDYGHASISDMSPVALFMDGVSMATAYLVWSLCPTAGGQESSTRYIRIHPDSAADPDLLGVAACDGEAWRDFISGAFSRYEIAVKLWEQVARKNPERVRVPQALRDDPSERAQRAVARMERNFAFDRARYFLPIAARTNLMLVQSARAWTTLCQNLCSHVWPEARQLGDKIRDELAFSAPRLIKHAEAKPSFVAGWQDEFASWRELAAQTKSANCEAPATASLHVDVPQNHHAQRSGHAAAMVRDLAHHDNRYAYLGSTLARTSTRFGWNAVAFAEIRDLNRHRTGTKWCPLAPQGFYAARDELHADDLKAQLDELETWGQNRCEVARQKCASADASWMAWTLLGTQFPFEHTTTADKFLYEAELRTGTGAHYRYAKHLHDALALWFEEFPETRGLVLEGSAEPE